MDNKEELGVEKIYYNEQQEKTVGYCQIVKVGNCYHISGVVAWRDGVLPPDLIGQVASVYANLRDILKAVGLTPSTIAVEKVNTVDMESMKDERIAVIRRDFYESAYPASTWIQVAGLYNPDLLVEIETTAYRES